MQEEKFELIVVFTKETELSRAEQILSNCNADYREGMDSSKGKIYFYRTGPKFILTFHTKKEKQAFLHNHKAINEIYEVYEPDWDIMKD